MIVHATQPHNLGIAAAKALLFAHGGEGLDSFSWDGASGTFRFAGHLSLLVADVPMSGSIVVGADSLRGELHLPDFIGQRLAQGLIEAEFQSRLAAILKG